MCACVRCASQNHSGPLWTEALILSWLHPSLPQALASALQKGEEPEEHLWEVWLGQARAEKSVTPLASRNYCEQHDCTRGKGLWSAVFLGVLEEEDIGWLPSWLYLPSWGRRFEES